MKHGEQLRRNKNPDDKNIPPYWSEKPGRLVGACVAAMVVSFGGEYIVNHSEVLVQDWGPTHEQPVTRPVEGSSENDYEIDLEQQAEYARILGLYNP